MIDDNNPPRTFTDAWDRSDRMVSGASEISGISTYAMNSTLSANEEYWRVRENKEIYPKNEVKIEEIKKEINKNWEKQAKSGTLVLISDSLLKFAPTFVFGALAYSVIVTPDSIYPALAVLLIFLIVLTEFYNIRIKNQAELYKIGEAQRELENQLKSLEQPK